MGAYSVALVVAAAVGRASSAARGFRSSDGGGGRGTQGNRDGHAGLPRGSLFAAGVAGSGAQEFSVPPRRPGSSSMAGGRSDGGGRFCFQFSSSGWGLCSGWEIRPDPRRQPFCGRSGRLRPASRGGRGGSAKATRAPPWAWRRGAQVRHLWGGHCSLAGVGPSPPVSSCLGGCSFQRAPPLFAYQRGLSLLHYRSLQL